MLLLRPSLPLRWPTSTLALISALTAFTAREARGAEPTLAGTWTATAMRSDWQLGEWGAACGPKPSGGGAPGGPVTISKTGNELQMQGAGRTYLTTECWEQFPGLQRLTHSASARGYRNTCKTASGDPRQATIITTISATDQLIHFDETGQYQFVIEGQNCTASVRRTRTLSLVLREGEAPPVASSTTAVATTAKPQAASAPRCENPGLPERLEVRPSRKLMRPGESFAFRTQVVDAKGCNLPLTPSWQVLSPTSGLSVTAPGSVTAAESAGEAEVPIEVTLGDRSVRVVVEIASRERYDALLQSRGLDESGESSEAAVLRVASETLGAREVVLRDDAHANKRLFVAVAGGLSLILGLIGLLLLRRSRARHQVAAPEPVLAAPPSRRSLESKVCPTCREEFPAEAEFCPNDGNRLVTPSALSSAAVGSVCRICGRGFDPGTTACPEHGEELVPAAAYAASQRPAAAPPSRSICPMCGTQFNGFTRFCGECGAAVVPIN